MREVEWRLDGVKTLYDPKIKVHYANGNLYFDECYLWDIKRFIFFSASILKKERIKFYPIWTYNSDIFSCNKEHKHANEYNPIPTKLLPNYASCNETNAVFCFVYFKWKCNWSWIKHVHHTKNMKVWKQSNGGYQVYFTKRLKWKWSSSNPK